MKRRPEYSQHFLRDPRFVKELIGHTSVKRSDTVYDIGAGSGIISSVLARRCKQVVAIEPETKTAEILKKNMAGYTNVTIVIADFLTLKLPDTPYKIVANIPFHISSKILHALTTAEHPPIDAYLIVQKQFAYKLLPSHKGFSSQLGMILGPRFAISIRKRLRRTDFWPYPKVDTVLLEIKTRDQPLIERSLLDMYEVFIRKNFTSPEAFHKLPLGTFSISPAAKPSSLTLDQWVVLFSASHNRAD